MSSKQPILVHIVFHPLSDLSRKLAEHVHGQLNGNPLAPGLRVPTVFSAFTAEGHLRPLRLGQAEKDFVVLLADAKMNIDERWRNEYAEKVRKECEGAGARFLPVQLTGGAWPMIPALNGTNFVRACLAAPEAGKKSAVECRCGKPPETEEERQTREKREQEEAQLAAQRRAEEVRRDLVVRRILVELCRFLTGLEIEGEENKDKKEDIPVKFFLSHTKLDLKKEPLVTQRFIQHLTADQPIKIWVDSGDIEAGSKFADEIKKGVEGSLGLLVVLTDLYATREWCRREILLAKQKHQPVVVVDALTGGEERMFPFLGNVPSVRWDGDPEKCVDAILRETLRHLHTTALLKRVRKDGVDEVFTRPPELATLMGFKAGKEVLYPDPPLGREESDYLEGMKVPFSTPLQRLAEERTLKDTKIALSMSESTDIADQGLSLLHLEAAMLEISRYMLVKGATLAYGGHLGAKGYTQKLFELSQAHAGLEFERIVNYMGWPMRPTDEMESDVISVAHIEKLPRPEGVNEEMHKDFVPDPIPEAPRPFAFGADGSVLHRFAWARGMTEMREFQADRSRSGVKARIVIGGKFGPPEKARPGQPAEKWYAGRIPGVLEEVVLSVQAGQPVFLIGAFGGTARLVMDIMRGIDRTEATWEYQKRAPFAEEMRQMYKEQGLEWMDYPEITALLRSDKARLLVNPGLNGEEQDELYDSVDPHRMVELILKGLNQLPD